MFKALLLTTVAGAGAANIPVAGPALVERSYGPSSNFCSTSNKKCDQAKQLPSVTAYCSSYLNIPKTATKTISRCSTITSVTTVFTKTVNPPASTSTITIIGCQEPSIATPPATPDLAPGPGKRYVRPKPACLSAFSKPKEISSACSCLSLKPSTTTTKTIITSVKTSIRTVKTETTVSAPTAAPATKTVYEIGPKPTFGILRGDDGTYLQYLGPGQIKGQESGIREITPPKWLDQDDRGFEDAILFQLNNPNGLSGQAVVINDNSVGDVTGRILAATGSPTSTDRRNFQVQFDTPGSPSLRPLTCSISQDPKDGTCPLDCQVVGADDVAQAIPSRFSREEDFYLGPPGKVSSATYELFAVTEGTDRGSGQV